MTAIARDASVAYNGITISEASTGYSLEGPIDRNGTYRSRQFQVGILVVGTDYADMIAKANALEAAFAVPRQDLTIVEGGVSRTWSESSRTAYEISVNCDRVAGSTMESPTTREYQATFSLKLPAILAGDAGLEDYSWSQSVAANGQRSISISVTYTMTAANTASEVLDAAIATLVSAIQDEVDDTANWKTMSTDTVRDRFDQEIGRTISITEHLDRDTLADVADSAIKSKTCFVSPTVIYAPSDVPNTEFPIELVAEYSVVVDRDVTTDLENVWLTKALPLVLSYVAESAELYSAEPPSQLMINGPIYDRDSNQISCSVRFKVRGAQKIIVANITETYEFTPPYTELPIYETTGFVRLNMPGLGAATAAISITVLCYGDLAEAEASARSLVRTPGKTSFGGGFRPTDYKPFSNQQASDIGISGGTWKKGPQFIQFKGPTYEGDPAIVTSECKVTTLWSYSIDGRNQTSSVERSPASRLSTYG